jgi:hypothetical protein
MGILRGTVAVCGAGGFCAHGNKTKSMSEYDVSICGKMVQIGGKVDTRIAAPCIQESNTMQTNAALEAGWIRGRLDSMLRRGENSTVAVRATDKWRVTFYVYAGDSKMARAYGLVRRVGK